MPLTFESLLGTIVSLVVIAGAVAGMWYSLASSIKQVEKDLASYKLQVTKEYASIENIKQVEERLIKSIDQLSATIEGMPQKIIEIINAAKRGVHP